MRLLYICAVTGILLGIGAVLMLGVRQSDESCPPVIWSVSDSRLSSSEQSVLLNVDTLIVTFRLWVLIFWGWCVIIILSRVGTRLALQIRIYQGDSL